MCHEKSKYNLPVKTVKLVIECFAKNQTKPSAIQKIIHSENLAPLSNSQLYNLKARTTQQALGHTATTLQEVIEWAKANRSLPSDPDEIFVGAFEYSVNNHNTLKYLRIKDFFKEWPDSWHEGYSIGDPSQNNGPEGSNRYLKENELDNNRNGVLQLITTGRDSYPLLIHAISN